MSWPSPSTYSSNLADPIEVLLDGHRLPIDRAVFESLFENSVVHGRAPYRNALELSKIQFGDLVKLARQAQIPYSLFFAPSPLVHSQLKAKSAKLLQGTTKKTFAVNSRDTVELRDIELILKDLLRKQELLKKHDASLVKNPIVGLLGKHRRAAQEEALVLLDALELSRGKFRSSRNKSVALEVLIQHLEAHQVLVARSVQHFMPQSLRGVRFSGLAVKDKKVPYIFLAGGNHHDHQEPAGRQIFTLTLMAVLVARGTFSPVTYDGSIQPSHPPPEYDLVGEILMPSEEVAEIDLQTLDAVQAAADDFKVTPSALAFRGLRLGHLTEEATREYLAVLSQEFRNRAPKAIRSPKPVSAIRKYNGREFSLRMLDAYDAKRIGSHDFLRAVCLNRIGVAEIDDFRAALA